MTDEEKALPTQTSGSRDAQGNGPSRNALNVSKSSSLSIVLSKCNCRYLFAYDLMFCYNYLFIFSSFSFCAFTVQLTKICGKNQTLYFLLFFPILGFLWWKWRRYMKYWSIVYNPPYESFFYYNCSRKCDFGLFVLWRKKKFKAKVLFKYVYSLNDASGTSRMKNKQLILSN